MLLSIHPKDPEPRKIKTAVSILEEGGVLICPTDTVYAYVCSSHSARAIEAVTRLKGVKAQKADLSLICQDLSQLSTYAKPTDTAVSRIKKKALPAPSPFIVPARNEIPRLFKNNRRTVGIRVPDHPIPQAIVRELGHALVVASVHDPDKVIDHTTDPEVIHKNLGYQVDMVIDGGIGGMQGSTVIDLSDGEPVVIREGAGSLEDLL